MQRETKLAGAMAVLLIALVATPLAVPGILQEPDEDVRPSALHLQEEDSTVRVLSVPGRTADLQLDTRIAHRGGASENVTVEVRAIDDDSGLLVDQVYSDVGDVRAGDRSLSVLNNLTVERAGGYRIETIVYQDGERVARGTRQISGVQALTPVYAQSPVGFERFENAPVEIPTIAVDPTAAENNRTELSVSAALTNGGDTSAGDVTLRLRARQVESNVIAAQAQDGVGSIRAGRTVWQEISMTVPSDYNYYIDAFLLKDGVVVDTALGVANLDPTRTVDSNETREEVEFDTGDFAEETPGGGDEGGVPDRPEETVTSSSGPGFGVALTLVALLAIALLTARRQTNN